MTLTIKIENRKWTLNGKEFSKMTICERLYLDQYLKIKKIEKLCR